MSMKMSHVGAGNKGRRKMEFDADALVNDRTAFKFFDSSAVVQVSRNGKANMRVVLGDDNRCKSTGHVPLTSSTSIVGTGQQFTLELDPNEGTRALVFKTVDTRRTMRNKFGKAIKVAVNDLKRNSAMLFEVYLNTMRKLGLPVDDGLLDDTPWIIEHVICLMWRHYCNGKSYAFSPEMFPSCVDKVIRNADLTAGERMCCSNTADHKK
ncbi:hypothetical protein BC940DRAFT_5268 [Gongronella butleri]|nr:hypothetical protein BC940DRAFT_5268 [Gongronella butleri]